MHSSSLSPPVLTLSGPFNAWLKHRSLTIELARRDVLGRYRGASFGLLWSLISPFFMLIVYTVAFGYILRARWPGTTGDTADFAMLLFMGLIVHGFFAECLTRAPALIVGNANLVKKIVFPLDVLPWTVVLSALFHAFANVLVFVLLNMMLRGEIHATVLLWPLVLVPLAFVALGVIWLLSSLSVFLRDIGQVTGVLATALLFLSSAIIPVETLPEGYQVVFRLNPLTFIIDQAREVAFWGRLPDWQGLGLYLLGAVGFAYFGFAVFQKTRRGFADVL
ncbi:ABC transporter permease [Coralloluteibacterium thermophilus]|uniref:Transport permease protein n=1 Tax=Coralloluteibacterium thermophilum TaxID=2707049 RepID=A0ABV9NEX0_9GAMM